jgi:glutathione-specific gamma-glutamylcyclotransferase
MLPGRIPRHSGREVLVRLWAREMSLAVYDPRWLTCHTSHGPVRALAFTLSRKSPSHTGLLSEDEYRRIFAEATGIYGTTLEYAHSTLEELRRHNIRDRELERLLKLIGRG